MIVQDGAAYGRVQEATLRVHRLGVDDFLIVVRGQQVNHFTRVTQPDRAERFHFARFERQQHFFDVGEGAAFTLRTRLALGQVVDSQHHVLGRNRNRLARSGRQNVVRRQHQHAGFDLRFRRQRNVYRHLVAVEVGVERRANQRVDLDCFAFHQHRLECLNAQTVKGRSAVQHHRMVFDDLFQDVPNDRFLLFHHFLGLLDGGAVPGLFQPVIDKRLEQFQRHLLRQTALVQLEFGTDHDHRTSGVVHALAQQVLPEASLLALERVRQRLQRTVVRATQHAATASVVEQRVDGFLQHALFVAHDDFGSVQVHQLLQPVVAVDDAAIKVVQVGGGKTAAVQWNQGTQLRRNHRNHIQNHPVRLVAALAECLDNFQALGVLEPLLQRVLVLHLLAQFARQSFNVNPLQQFLDGFRAHHGLEAGGTVLLVQFAVLGFVLDDFVIFYRRVSRLDHHVSLEVQNRFKIAQRDVEQVPDAAGQSLEEPHMRAGGSQLDVAQALTPYFRERHFHAALVADDAAMLHPLVLAAQTLPIRYRTENARAKQSITLRLEGPVVDGFGLGYFAMRPAPDLLRRGQADADGVKISDRVCHVKGARTIQGGPPLSRGRTPPLRGSQNQCRVSGFQFPVWPGSPSRLWPAGWGATSRRLTFLKPVSRTLLRRQHSAIQLKAES